MSKTTIIERSASEISSIIASSATIRQEALQARDMVEVGYMKLAKCLYDIYTQNIYQTWNFSNFESYVDTELQFNYRKAMYLIEIYNKALMLNMDMERLERIGWTKAKELIRIVDQNNTDEWLEVAENSTTKELNFKIKTEKESKVDTASVIDDAPSITTITFKLGMAEKSLISEALEESARLINSDDYALAFANIAAEWLEMKGVVPLQTTLEDHIEHLERIYGRRLIISESIESANEEDILSDYEEDDTVAVKADDDLEELF